MRVIAGKFKGRTLVCPSGLRLRPTADPMKETMFNILGGKVCGSTAVDLFAGVGALGIEALSRGAREVHFVERNRTALRYLRRNLEALGITGEAVVVGGDVFKWAGRQYAHERQYSLVFCDPPYGQGLLSKVLEAESEFPFIKNGGTLVMQHHVKEQIACSSERYVLVKQRILGDTALSVLTVG